MSRVKARTGPARRAAHAVALGPLLTASLFLLVLWRPARAAEAGASAGRGGATDGRPAFSSPADPSASLPFCLCPAAPGVSAAEPDLAAGVSLSFSLVREAPTWGLRAESAGDKQHHAPGRQHEAGKPKRRTGRAWLELGTFMAISQTRYWVQWGRFIEDWQFHLSLSDQTRRILGFQGVRFDSNNFTLNWTHAAAGSIYYQFARTNNLSWLQSLSLAFAGSAWWEVVTEFKEVISISDLVFTSVGGYAIGEPWFQVSRYLSRQPGILLRGLSFFNPILKVNDWFDRKDPEARLYSPPGWHDFSIFGGMRRLSRPGFDAETGAYFGFRTQLIGLPEYGRPGRFSETFTDAARIDIDLDYAVRGGHADETNLATRALTWGLFRQTIDDNLEGSSLTFGLGTGFSYFKKRPVWDLDYNPVPVKQGIDLRLDEPRNFTDKLAVVNVAGPVLDWTVFRRDFRLRTVAEAYFDFGLINSYALDAYSALNDISGMKTTVLYYGYYYGYGTSLSAETTLEWKSLRARALASYHAWGSFDARDRYQSEVTNNAHLADTRVRLLFELGWRVPGAPVEAFARVEGIRRWGRIAGFGILGTESRTFAGLRYGF